MATTGLTFVVAAEESSRRLVALEVMHLVAGAGIGGLLYRALER